ncbi:MAG: NAD/FAD-utilizing enzyme [Pseudomonadota bacterium]
MRRYYYLDDELDDLERISQELQSAGIPEEQIYVLTQSDDEVDRRNFNYVWSILKKDTVRSAVIGSLIGFALAWAVLVAAWVSGLPTTYTWVPFIFLAVVVLGFCTWEGGLWGIQQPHHEFKRFQGELAKGRHLLLVEAENQDSQALRMVTASHPKLEKAGEGRAMPKLLRMVHILFNRYRRWGP